VAVHRIASLLLLLPAAAAAAAAAIGLTGDKH